MYLFLITFLSIYGAIHLYAFRSIRGGFRPANYTETFLKAWMALMTLAPLLVRLLERAGMDRCAILLAWPGYIWMGFIIIFVSALVLFDGIRAVCRLADYFFSLSTPAFLTSPVTFRLALVAAVAASGYACYEARQIRTEHTVIESSKLPAGTPGIRIVQISDLHVGMMFREKRLEEVLTVIREAQPDIIVSTGDLVDGKLNREDVITRQNSLAFMLASLKAPGGKYAVAGNHEFYAGIQQALAFTAAAGFTVLRNQSLQLQSGITISGVDDETLFEEKVEAENAENRLLDAVPLNAFHLLLKHRPEIPKTSDGRFDLQLSGHVHGGQIFPFNFLTRLKYRIPCGSTRTAAGSTIHVSRGTGTWGPPMRLFAPPEVTVIDVWTPH